MSTYLHDEEINVSVELSSKDNTESRVLVLRPTSIEIEYEVVEYLNGDVDFAYMLSRENAIKKFNQLLLQYDKFGWK